MRARRGVARGLGALVAFGLVGQAPLPTAHAAALPAAEAPRLTVVGQPTVSANGVVFSVACQAPTNEECHGAGALSTAEQLSGGRVVALLPAEHGLATATVGVGESAFALNSGQTRNVVVPLDRTGRELFERFHPLAVTLTVTLSNGAGAAPTSVTERKLVIIALNTRLVGHSIERHIFAHRHLRSRVRCPAVVIQAKGNTFTCWATGTVRQGRHREHYKTPFTVEQQDSRGDIYYHS